MSQETTRDENSYRSIFKGLSAFAGVQAFQILVNIVRGKFVAILLGPEGMGIASIFNSVFATVAPGFGLGINLAVVREAADAREDTDRIVRLAAVVGSIVRWSSLAAALFCILFCMPLSRMSFGSASYTWQFMLLGVALLLNVRSQAPLAILQGLHKVKRVAKASLVGSLTGLLVGVPLYWLFGNKGIVPAMVALQLALYLFYAINLRRETGPVSIPWNLKPHRPMVKGLLSVGLLLLSGPIIGAGCEYAVNLIIRLWADLDSVGLFQAANSLTNQYSGVVFAALAMDYFPRLTAAISDHGEVARIVNRQTEVLALAIAPVACTAIVLAPIIVRLLLSSEFESIVPLLRLMSLGVVLKALQYPLGYVPFAKDDRRLYFWLECIGANALFLGSISAGFIISGLEGLGWAYIVQNALTIAVYLIVNRLRYRIGISRVATAEGAVAILAVAACCLCAFIGSDWLSWTILMVSALYSLIRLRSRLHP